MPFIKSRATISGLYKQGRVPGLASTSPSNKLGFLLTARAATPEPTLSPTEEYDLWEQASDLMDFSYKAKEGELYAVLYRNKLVPTQSGLLFTGLLTAEKIRALTLKVMVSFSPTNIPVELRYVSMSYDQSKGHNLR